MDKKSDTLLPPSGRAPASVLVVDDHPSTASTMARAIAQLGPWVNVLSAESGEQALGLAKKVPVDVLITDMVMPGMTGLDLIEKLQAQQRGRRTYTVLMTAYDVPTLIEAARCLKVDLVIGKPIPPDRICQLITRAVASARTPTDFLASLSHDLKHPLTLIQLSARLLPKTGPLNEQQMKYVSRINDTAAAMGRDLQNFLELDREENPAGGMRMDSVDVNALVSEVVEEFRPHAEEKRQSFRFDPADPPPIIRGDPFRLRQAVCNLADNAVQYTPEEGSIRITVETRAGEAVIRIRDTGCGIPADDLPFIFERFYRGSGEETKQIRGNGIGLAIVKSVVDRHRGRVEAESEYGMGSCFTVSLPLCPEGRRPAGK